MFREKLLFVIGILIIAIPNLGFSNFIDKIILAVCGLIVIFFAYGMHFQKTKKAPARKPRAVKEVREKETVIATEIPKFKEQVTGFTYVKKEGRDVS